MQAIVAMLLLVGSLVDAKCYLPDGTGATNPQWRACSDDPKDPLSNICCALNRKNPAGGLKSAGDTADTCLPNGLCQNESFSDSGNQTIYYRRSYCTSQEWESGNCLTTCGKGESGFKDMTPCDGTSTSERWCCGANNKDCCSPDSNIGAVILAKNFLDAAPTTVLGSMQPSPTSSKQDSPSSSSNAANPSSSAGASSSVPPAAAAQPTSSAPSTIASSAPQEDTSSPPSSPQDPSPQGLATGAKVGIAIGAVVGGAALIGIGAWLALASQRRKLNSASSASELPSASTAYPSELAGSYGRDQKNRYLLQERSIHGAGSTGARSFDGSANSLHAQDTRVEMGMGLGMHQQQQQSPYYEQRSVALGELPERTMASELPADEVERVKGIHW
ncbi:unnamed protein product [Periconia digitata]|uniref:Uncharacterized protein n=1 Tax=Periconia digitata TaxID=1303443 RepID=A0A9W4U7F9_9PLEO|nr:unnamed protein product [Periconia digitata]